MITQRPAMRLTFRRWLWKWRPSCTCLAYPLKCPAHASLYRENEQEAQR